MRRLIPFAAVSLIALPLTLVACGDDDDDSTGSSGGTSSMSGGAKASGGKSAGGTSAGGSAHGGATGDGGTAPSEGGAPEGGKSTQGGAVSTGGSAGNTGSTETGGKSQGGSAGEAGASAEGGAMPVGNGGSGQGGSTSMGGNTAEGGGTDTGSGGTSAEGGGNAGGAGGEPSIMADTIDNADFETGTENHVDPPGWTVVGTAGAVFLNHKEPPDQWHSHSGTGFLDAWLGTAYTSNASQVVDPLPEGDYSFSIWHYGGAYTAQYIYVKGYNSADPEEMTKLDVTATPTPPGNYGDAPLTVPTVHVSSGKIEIGIHLECPEANCWTHFDDAVLTKVE